MSLEDAIKDSVASATAASNKEVLAKFAALVRALVDIEGALTQGLGKDEKFQGLIDAIKALRIEAGAVTVTPRIEVQAAKAPNVNVQVSPTPVHHTINVPETKTIVHVQEAPKGPVVHEIDIKYAGGLPVAMTVTRK